MADLRIITDNKFKQFKYDNEIPEKVLKNDFDWLDKETIDGFIKYRNRYYHVSEFMSFSGNAPKEFYSYDGYLSDSFFSGILIKLSNDGGGYKIATYIS